MTIHRIFTTDIFRSMFDALPLPVFMVDDNVMVQHFNTTAVEFLFRYMPPLFKVTDHMGGDRPLQEGPEDSWRNFFHHDAAVTQSIRKALAGSRVVRRYTRLNNGPERFQVELETEMTCSPFTIGASTNVLLIFNETRPTDDMKGLVPICSVCHKIIDEKGALTRIEALAKEYEGVQFSHGLCATCLKAEMAKVDNYAGTNASNSISMPGIHW